MNINPQRAQALFLAALEFSDPASREQMLDRECSGDGALRQRVEALLVAHDAVGGFGEEPSHPPVASTIDAPVKVRPGALLAGRYKLLEEIGEGGMGTVWVAEQKEPVRRKVAIKLVKAGMDSRQVLSRFEAERQALALMDHPNIAKVFDGGMTEQERPFFVMEYVKGVPLTKYCDQVRLSVQERLKLFIAVCQAVQHAHQKGIIHRDLKPSNILVCLYDGQPVPKVIDFGLAKAMHQSLTEHTLHTLHGLMVGTPLYMSPEQAELNNLDVDTRTDIYSLGVILYELLTGTTPLEKLQVKQAALNEVLRLIKEVEPPKPSTRLSGSASLPSIAAQRGVEPAKLSRAIRGDLDWIVMKALDKERSRRYETANGLARDIERFLNDELVEASPPKTSYRLRKFIRKHRAALGLAVGGTAIAASLLVSAVVSWSNYSLSTANSQLQEANQKIQDANAQLQEANLQLGKQNVLLDERRKQAEAAQMAVEAAQKLAYDRATQANGAYQLMIDRVRTSLAGIPQLRDLRKQLVMDAAAGLEKLPDDPEDRKLNVGLQKAKNEEFLYRTYLALGEPSKAVPHIEAALEILQKRNAAQKGTDATRFNLATALLAKAQARQSFERDMELSMKLSGEAVTLLEAVMAAPNPKAFKLSSGKSVPFEGAPTSSQLKEFALEKGSVDPLLVRQELLRCRNVHTATLWQQGRIAEALKQARRNVELLDETFEVLPQLKALPPEQKRAVRSGMAWIHQLRAVTALRAGEIEEAQQQQQEALDLARLSVQNSNNSWDGRRALADILGFAGDLFVSQKDDDKAREAYEEALNLARELHVQDPTSEDGRNTANIELIRLAGFEKTRGPDKYLKLYGEAVEIAREMVKADAKGQTKQVALALSLAPTGAHVEASQLAGKLLAISTKPDAELLIDMARVYSQCSAAAGLTEAESSAYRNRALQCLTQAADQGYRDPFYLTFHPDFSPLRNDQAFTDLLKKLQSAK